MGPFYLNTKTPGMIAGGDLITNLSKSLFSSSLANAKTDIARLGQDLPGIAPLFPPLDWE